MSGCYIPHTGGACSWLRLFTQSCSRVRQRV